ncbi:hypothetical protein EDB87DRAFT_1685470 [Lactarius vividus]|nr:hypothetical protein EDB87DRAFT_1685470 [Lactarius vividus]
MDTNTREYQRQAIDAQLESLEESIQTLTTLRLRRNTLAPISSLPTEVIATIFFFLRLRVTFSDPELDERPDNLAWLRVTDVCHQWREIALSQPLFWDYVDFNTVSSAGAAEILARAKTVPLHLEARVPSGLWNDARFSAFQKELQVHTSHIYHLRISGDFYNLCRIFEGLVSPAPFLESLSLSAEAGVRALVPDTIFDGSTPRLSRLELSECFFSWNSPLLGSLKHLEISSPFERPNLSVWLDVLDEMPQLETLVLHWASPIAPPSASLSHGIDRTLTLPSLTHFEISSFVRDCGFALAHLILPALTSLCIISKSCYMDQSDVREVLPYVSRHAHGSQDAQPLQSVVIDNEVAHTHILAWTQPDIGVEFPNELDFFDSMHSARVAFSITNEYWFPVTDTGVFDAVMDALPLEGLVTLTAHWEKRTSPQLWLHHAPKWPRLWLVRLTPFAAHGFREALLEDNGGRESPLLPSLTKLVLVETALIDTTPSAHMTLRLCDALMKRVEQGVPLETLDLRLCLATSRAVELLSEIVVDVLCPEETVESEEKMISISGIFVGDESDSDDD